MDCQAPVLGHSALRCAGLSRSQARLQVLPATIYLLGFLLIVGTWIKLALARRIFSLRLVSFLSLCGFLDFILAVTAVNKAQDGASSSALGGVASLICLFQLLAIYLFLPSHLSLPGFLDRLLIAFFTSSVILDILSSVHHWQGHLTNDPDRRIIVYAEAACLIIFYLCSISASQFHRFFTIVRYEKEAALIPPPVSLLATITFLAAITFFIAQSCVAFSFFASFAAVMTASTFSALGYVLLVATYILENRTQDLAQRDDITIMPPVSSNADDPSMEEKGLKIDSIAANKNPSQLNVVSLPQPAQTQRSRSASNFRGSEAGSVIWIGHSAPRLEADAKTAVSSRPRQSTRFQSGISMTSWDRVRYLVSKRNQARPSSGLTYYGSESSYPEGIQTRPTSMLSSFAQAMGGYGPSSAGHIPPVPAIDPRHLISTSQMELGLAQPLSQKEAQMKSTEPLCITPKKTKHGSIKVALSSLFRSPVSSPNEIEILKDHSQSMTTLAQSRLSQGSTTLPAQYQSSKLFPATEWQKEVEEVRVNSPHASEIKHTVQDRSSIEISQDADASDGSYTYVNEAEGQSPKLTSSHNVNVIRKISMAEDRAVNLAGSIMFPVKA